MLEKDFQAFCARLPSSMTFPYYAGREDAWLLAQHLSSDMPVAQLRKSPWAKLLDRPLVRPLVAGCGGVLKMRDVQAVAYAGHSENWDDLSDAAWQVLERLFSTAWQDFEITFGRWGSAQRHWNMQTSRRGVNLVLQLGFPAEHAALMGKYLPRDARKAYEFARHPVRRDGRPTLAWARLDVDPKSGQVLIEELQTDWLRFVRAEIRQLAERAPQSRALRRAEAYDRQLRHLYDKTWSRVLMLAVLEFVREFLGRQEVFLHQPGPGAIFKGIAGRKPPVSLYTTLPKSFCFAPVETPPQMLAYASRKMRAAMRRTGDPLFWHMAL